MPYVKRLALHTGIICAVWCAFLQQTVYGADQTCELRTDCKPGIVLPVWGGKPSTGEIVGRAFVYLLALLFFFLGVSIISDRFMSAIEIITSKEKEIRVTDKQTGFFNAILIIFISNLFLTKINGMLPHLRGP